DTRTRGLPATDNAAALRHLRPGGSLVQPVVAPVEHAGVLPRLPCNLDRGAGSREGDAVSRDRFTRLDREPPLLAVDVELDHFAGDDLGFTLAGDLAEVGAPLPVRRPEAAAIDPVGVRAVQDQVLLPAVLRHRRVDCGRG